MASRRVLVLITYKIEPDTEKALVRVARMAEAALKNDPDHTIEEIEDLNSGIRWTHGKDGGYYG